MTIDLNTKEWKLRSKKHPWHTNISNQMKHIKIILLNTKKINKSRKPEGPTLKEGEACPWKLLVLVTQCSRWPTNSNWFPWTVYSSDWIGICLAQQWSTEHAHITLCGLLFGGQMKYVGRLMIGQPIHHGRREHWRLLTDPVLLFKSQYARMCSDLLHGQTETDLRLWASIKIH